MERALRELNRANLHRKKVAIIKVNNGCMDCGYNKDHRALEFDHRENIGLPWTGKQRTVAAMMYFSWKRIQEEIDKCDVVCCNCHAIRTSLRRKEAGVRKDVGVRVFPDAPKINLEGWPSG